MLAKLRSFLMLSLVIVSVIEYSFGMDDAPVEDPELPNAQSEYVFTIRNANDRCFPRRFIEFNGKQVEGTEKPEIKISCHTKQGFPIPADWVTFNPNQFEVPNSLCRTCGKSNKIPHQSGLGFFARTAQKLDKHCDCALSFVGRNPKASLGLVGASAALAGVTAYKKNVNFRQTVRTRSADLQERSKVVYYDVIESYAAPVVFAWDELKDQSITHGDVARIGLAAGATYSMYKTAQYLNNTYDLTKKVGPAVRALKHNAGSLLNRIKSGSLYTLQQLKENKGKTVLALGGLITGLAAYKAYTSFNQPDQSYSSQIRMLWQSFSNEQLNALNLTELLPIVNGAESNPYILRDTPELVALLTQTQLAQVDSIISQYEDHVRRIALL